jgi:hypothetical protein
MYSYSQTQSKGQLTFLVRDITLGRRRGGAGIALPRAPGHRIHPPHTRGPFGPLWHFKDTHDEEKYPKGCWPSKGH